MDTNDIATLLFGFVLGWAGVDLWKEGYKKTTLFVYASWIAYILVIA